MPDKGETRSANGETRQWTGERWEPVAPPTSVDQPKSFGVLDYVPGLRDVLNLPSNIVKGAQALPDVARGVVHEPAATMKGFVKGTSEAATPSRVGLLALLTGGATLPAALGAAGGEALAEGARVATDAPNAAQSFPEAAGHVAEAASIPAIAGALGAVPGAVERLGGPRELASRGLGAALGGYAGYKMDGIPGAIVGAIGGGAVSGGGPRLRALRNIITGGADDAAAAVSAAPASAAPVEPPAVKPDVTLSGIRLSPDALARNIEATNLRDVEGFSHDVAGKLAGIPGAGKVSVTNVPMGEHAITDEMIANARGSAPPSMRGLQQAVATGGRTLSDIAPPSDLEALQEAIYGSNVPTFPNGGDATVGRLLDANPNSALSRVRVRP